MHAERPGEVERLKEELVQVMLELLSIDPNAFTLIHEAQREALYLSLATQKTERAS